MANKAKTLLIIGTGTIGEPLIGLFSRMKDKLGIDEVIFHKRTPLKHERPKVNSLVEMGASLAVDDLCTDDFLELGHNPSYTYNEAIEKASVVIDCTPSGNVNKNTTYKNYKDKLFIAQGSEKGFGIPYALGVNDEKLLNSSGNFLQIVSCNTHTVARLLKCLSGDFIPRVLQGDFVCMRRANDLSQDEGFIPSIVCGKHGDDRFGTHHARDVSDLFNYKFPLPIFSSAVKTNTQYMHTIRFSMLLDEVITKEEVVNRIKQDPYIASTLKKSTNSVFSYGRDHGFYGRIYNQGVICMPSLSVSHFSDTTKITGFAFTPQDGNSLLSSVAAALYGFYGKEYKSYLSPLSEYIKDEV
jgi:hypothetical protein